MIRAWRSLYLSLRQRTFPREFRIPPAEGPVAWESLAADVRRLVDSLRRAGPPRAADPPAGADGAMQPGLAVALCDDYWRIRRNADSLAGRNPDSREVRMILRHLESLADVLREEGLECVDPTGQDYDIGRTDFEQIGDATPVAGLPRARIALCERPAVWLRGRLVRPARGLVDRPA